MKYRYFLPLFLSAFVVFSSRVSAQLVVDNAFLQGVWLEVAIAPNGSWGNTVTVPAAYHTRAGASTFYTDPVLGTTATGNGMDFSFDQGHDGWAVGVTPWVGAYFLPGTPFNGWQVQIDDTMASAFYSSSGFDTAEGGNFGGTVDQYTGPSCWNPRAPMAGRWRGTYGLRRKGLRNAMQIAQVTEVDSFASIATVTTKFFNTTDSILKGVYYMATADPDNDVTLSGSFPTTNHIAYQDVAAPYRHEVWARPPSAHQDAFSGLATTDCRAKVLIYNSWPPSMTPGNNLDKVWAGTTTGMGPTYYPLGSTTYLSDIAYGLVFNIGNIAPHDSAFITYAWIFSDTNTVDSILYKRVPQLSTEGKVYSQGQRDTVLECTMTGCNVLNDSMFIADIINGETREWGLSTWKWTPSTGLSTAYGTRVTINFSLLTGPTTYTITGTPYAAWGSCNPTPPPMTFTLHVIPCYSVTADTPCALHDTLHFTINGDTAGATFFTYGPTGYSQTGFNPIRTPYTNADTGVYYIVKTIGTKRDTTLIHTTTRPMPTFTASSNSVICSGTTLTLTATLFAPGTDFAWSGPNGFASTLQNPTRTGARVIDTGIYMVADVFDGCRDTEYVHVIIDSTPAIPTIVTNSPICSQYEVLTMTGNTVTPGVRYVWSGPLSYTSSLKSVVVPGLPTSASGSYTVTVTRTEHISCSNWTSAAVVIDSTPAAPVLTTNAPVCSGTPLTFTATSLAGSDYSWTGPIGFTSAFQNPTIPYAITANTGIYTVTATFTYPGHSCTSSPATIYAQVDSTALPPHVWSNSPGFPGVTICQGDTLKLYGADTTMGVAWSWVGPNSFTSTEQNPMILKVLPAAIGTYSLTVTLGAGCIAVGTTDVKINPTPPLAVTSNSPVCSGSRDTLFLQAISGPGATFIWSGPYTFSSTLQNPLRSPVLTEYDGIYSVTAFLNGCFNIVNDTVIINKTPPAPWMKWLTFCQFYPPDPLQAMGENIMWYTKYTDPLVGTSVAPILNTKVIGETYYYSTQTVKGCISYIDSVKITVYPTPVVKVSPNVSVCPHDTALLVAVDTDPLAYYHWYPSMYLSDTSTATVVVRPETNTHYTVIAQNMYGCTDTGTVYVTVKAGATLDVGDAVTLYPGEKYQLNPATNCSFFSWFPSNGLSNDEISNPIASPQVSTKYIVTGLTNYGCKAVDSVDIIVKRGSLLDLPNAFAPGNGPNSTFKVVKRGIATLKSFSIFDRWGVKVFETSNIEEGWDGTYKGKPQPFGVYIYQVEAVTSIGEGFSKQGNVTLIR